LLVFQLPHPMAARALIHVRVTIAVSVIPRIIWPQAFVVGTSWTVPFVETMVGWPAAVFRSDVPFAKPGSSVSRLGDNISHGAFPRDQAAIVATQCDGVISRTNGVATGHEG